MSVGPSTTPVSSSEPPASVWKYAPGPADSATQFGERHNLHGWALPFRGHAVDPIELLEELGTYLDARPGGCQRVTKNAVREGVSVAGPFWEYATLVEHAMLVHGWWLGGRTTIGRYYCNPNYHHRHPESDVANSREERRALFRKAAALGLLSPSDIAPACGYASDTSSNGSAVTKAAYRSDFAWGDRRAEGRRRMGRTWKTLSHWDYSQRAIARAFGTSASIVCRTIKRVPEFQPPDDPTAEVIPR